LKNELLLIEDDENLGESIKKLLTLEGFGVSWVKSLAEARELLSDDIKMIVLDWMLPDGQGIDFLKELRASSNLIPVIMLTARVELIDKIIGLESGANDYMTKPFEPRELVARIRVQLRTRPTISSESTSEINLGDLVMDCAARKTFYKGVEVEFTKMEFDLLRLLVDSPGRAFSREEILNKVWGYDSYPTTRTVDTHILQLRQKMDDGLIETVRGVGYRLKV
jgi:DNA-binding response OmpR family regulator